jgi:hypothetical protein
MHLHFTLDVGLFTLGIEHVDDDAMNWGFLAIGHYFDELESLMKRHDL